MHPRLLQKTIGTSILNPSSGSLRYFSSDLNWEYDYDVLIVGGGIVGSALACKLGSLFSSKDFRVGLVEARKPPSVLEVKSKDIPDARVYTIAPSSKKLLSALGVWDTIVDRKHDFSQMHVFDSKGLGFMHFDSSLVKRKSLGHVVEHNMIQSALYEKIEDMNSAGEIDLLCPSEVIGLDFRTSTDEPSGPIITAINTDGNSIKEVKCRLVVAADGNASKIKRLRGLGQWGWSYNQRAIVCTVQLAQNADTSTAWQRFLPNGPVALLPLWNDFASLVWSNAPERSEHLSKLPPEEFINKLNEALSEEPTLPSNPLEHIPLFGNLMGEAINAVHTVGAMASVGNTQTGHSSSPPTVGYLSGPRMSFDLSFSQCHSYIAQRIAMIGDAAHSVHPMAGQGLNLGLSDVESLTKALTDGILSGADIGSPIVLEMYDRDRKMKNLAMMSGVDILHHLFTSDSMPITLARNVGMSMVHLLPPLKRTFVKVAMGI